MMYECVDLMSEFSWQISEEMG